MCGIWGRGSGRRIGQDGEESECTNYSRGDVPTLAVRRLADYSFGGYTPESVHVTWWPSWDKSSFTTWTRPLSAEVAGNETFGVNDIFPDDVMFLP